MSASEPEPEQRAEEPAAPEAPASAVEAGVDAEAGADAAAPPPAPAEPSIESEYPLFHSFVAQLSDDDPAIRSTACWTLGQLRYRPCTRILGRMLTKDPDSLVRVQAAQALARVRGPAAAQALIRGLKEEDDLVRDSCVIGLGTLRDPQALYPLEEMRKKVADEDDLARRLDWAIAVLRFVDAPGRRPDRRRGGVSKKISRYLERIHEDPRSGIAHNNLAVAYFHAAEHELAVRHCKLAKALGARVQWLWDELRRAGFDPASSELSPEDQAFLDNPDAAVRVETVGGEDGGAGALRLQREPRRTDLEAREAREKAKEEGELVGLGGGESLAYRPPPKQPPTKPEEAPLDAAPVPESAEPPPEASPAKEQPPAAAATEPPEEQAPAAAATEPPEELAPEAAAAEPPEEQAPEAPATEPAGAAPPAPPAASEEASSEGAPAAPGDAPTSEASPDDASGDAASSEDDSGSGRSGRRRNKKKRKKGRKRRR